MRKDEVAADEGVRLDEMFIEEYEAPLTLTIDIEEGAILEREEQGEERPTLEELPGWMQSATEGSAKKRSKSRTIGLLAVLGAVGIGILAWGLHARKRSSWFARLGFAS